MIGRIIGTLTEVHGNVGLIETTSGVGYQLYLVPYFLSLTPPCQVKVYTYLQVREDALVLYGFYDQKEHSAFLQLLTVSGVGPKTAFNIISAVKVDDFYKAVQENNLDFFTSISGLGKKTALKIILEISHQMKQNFPLTSIYMSESDKTVVDALISLGFRSHDARSLLAKLPKNLPVEEKIKQALRLSVTKNRPI